MLKEFREFAMKGNVVDLAVGVIIGAAFGAIVSSMVADVIMPIIGAVTGGLDFSNYFTPLSKAVTATQPRGREETGCGAGVGQLPDPDAELHDRCLRPVHRHQGA